jgi:hypothetical protein
MAKPELDPREALRNCGIHARQINEQIAEADKQRSDAVAAGDLDAVRRINRRVSDLKNDLATLVEGRALFEARVAKLDAEGRIAACDAAAEGMKPALEEVCAAIEQLEEQLLLAGRTYTLVQEKFKAFEEARAACAKALPMVPHWRASFTIDVFRAYLSDALEFGGRRGLDRIYWAILEEHDRRWSAITRERAAEYVANLKSAVREVEEERAAQLKEVAK